MMKHREHIAWITLTAALVIGGCASDGSPATSVGQGTEAVTGEQIENTLPQVETGTGQETEDTTGEQTENTLPQAETGTGQETEAGQETDAGHDTKETQELPGQGDAFKKEEPDGMREISTMELVRDMGIGINLGNTFESCGDWIAQWGDGSVQSYETAWGSPMITQEMIQGYADAGFGVLRIPVAWSNLMGEDYTISEDYMAAVREVVDWTLDTGMYAIINIHHDNGWMADFPTDTEECMYHYSRIWTQVSEAFQNYGDHLMFESLNEEGCWDSVWNQYSGSKNGKEEVFSLLNDINQTFVDTVRSSGGNNPRRHLLIAGYATNIELTSDELYHMPADPAGRCAVSVHYYTPPVFAILEEDADWGKCRSDWGTEADFKELQKYMDMVRANFIDRGIPVIMGEYGCPKNNKEEESVRLFLTSVCKSAYDNQICPVLWDVTGLHYDRSSCKMTDIILQEALMKCLEQQ